MISRIMQQSTQGRINNNPWPHAVLLLNIGLIVVRYRPKARVKLALFKTGHVN